MAKSENTKQAVDIAKPSNGAPDATTRPIIVGHGPVVQDPMMVKDADTKDGEQKITVTTHTTKVIAPLGDAADKTEPEEEKKEPETDAQKTPDETPDKDDAEAKTEDSNNSAVVDAVVAEQANKKKSNEPSEEELKKREELDKLVEEKKYFVHISTPREKRHARWTLVILILVLLVGVYLAADAGFIHIGFKLPIDLIKN